MKLIDTPNIPQEQAIRDASVHVVDSIGIGFAVKRGLELRQTPEGDAEYVTSIIAPIEVGEIVIKAKTGEVRRCPTRQEIARLRHAIKHLVAEFMGVPQRTEEAA